MSAENTARATVIPSHGVGKLVAPFPPGVSGNPGGRPTKFREVRALCRDRSLGSAMASCDMAENPAEDGRVRAVAAQQVLTWAYGKPPDYDPREDKPGMRINTSVLTPEERKLLLSLLRRGLVEEVEAQSVADPLQKIEGQSEP